MKKASSIFLILVFFAITQMSASAATYDATGYWEMVDTSLGTTFTIYIEQYSNDTFAMDFVPPIFGPPSLTGLYFSGEITDNYYEMTDCHFESFPISSSFPGHETSGIIAGPIMPGLSYAIGDTSIGVTLSSPNDLLWEEEVMFSEWYTTETNFYTAISDPSVWTTPLPSSIRGPHTIVRTGSRVPIPGAVWLLGSGLIGFVGLRKKWGSQ